MAIEGLSGTPTLPPSWPGARRSRRGIGAIILLAAIVLPHLCALLPAQEAAAGDPSIDRIRAFEHQGALARHARLRIRDLGRGTELGLARGNALVEGAEAAIGRLIAARGEGDGTTALLEKLWADPAWQSPLTDEERALFAERRRERGEARTLAARSLHAAALADAYQFDLAQITALDGALAALPVGPDDSIDRVEAAWLASDAGKALVAAQRQRLAPGPAAGAGADGAARRADHELWLATVAELGGLDAEERALLGGCLERATALAGNADPLDDPLLAKALATFAGPEVARSVATMRAARQGAGRRAVIDWILAELDRHLWLTEVQRGALLLVLERGDEGGARIDRGAPLRLAEVALPARVKKSIDAILDPDQDAVLAELLAGGEERR